MGEGMISRADCGNCFRDIQFPVPGTVPGQGISSGGSGAGQNDCREPPNGQRLGKKGEAEMLLRGLLAPQTLASTLGCSLDRIFALHNLSTML